MIIDLYPIGQRIIVDPLPTPERINETIIIPKDSKEFQLTEGIVLAVGPDCSFVSVGDRVYYGKYSGFVFDRMIDGKFHALRGMNEEDILFIVKDMKS